MPSPSPPDADHHEQHPRADRFTRRSADRDQAGAHQGDDLDGAPLHYHVNTILPAPPAAP